MVIVNKHLTKPKWSFKTGINVITQSYQRPIASAKPTNYIGGVQANFTIRAINALILEESKCCTSGLQTPLV